MRLISSLFRGVSRPANRLNVRLILEALEARQVMSAAALTAPTDLPYGKIAVVAQDEYLMDHGQLTYTDVTNIFAVADGTEQAVFNGSQVSFTPVANPSATATIKDRELKTLQTLVTDANLWGMSSAVADLAGKVGNYSPANETYQGNTLLASGTLAQGDLKAILRELVDKWFYGTDTPAIDDPGATYQWAKGSLFGAKGPLASDVAQGYAADCYFMSSLAETALQSPQTIKDMFTPEGNGVYIVRFYQYNAASGTWVADYVTVNRELPVNAQGQFVYANANFGGQPTNYTSTSNVLWVALAEKAYAQLAAEGWSRAQGTMDRSSVGGNPADNTNAYSSIDYGQDLVATQQITGFANASWVSFPSNHPNQAANYFSAVIADFQAGDIITFATNKHVPKSTGLLGYHVYSMTSYNAANQTVTLVNPYWYDGQKTETVTLTELEVYFQGCAVVTPN
jgi:hypothetical protein